MRKQAGRSLSIVFFLMVLLVGSSFFVLAADYTQKQLNEQNVMADLWYQQSGEARALYYQAFNLAKMVFDQDLEKNVDATRAVIVDIDETVLNNSPSDAGYVDTNNAYPDGWAEWIKSAKAEALPGAVSFLNYVVSQGADVYYISNRSVDFKDATIKNLKREGFPQADEEHVLLKSSTSDKKPRRLQVSKDHHIVLLMGDNLNDFSDLFYGKGVEGRMTAVDKVSAAFGSKFIVLPNPIYGDWEGAVYDYNWGLNQAQKSQVRKEHLIKADQ